MLGGVTAKMVVVVVVVWGGGTRLFVDPHVHCGRLLAPVLPSSKHPPSPLSLSPLNYYVHADLQVRKRGYESMNVS